MRCIAICLVNLLLAAQAFFQAMLMTQIQFSPLSQVMWWRQTFCWLQRPRTAHQQIVRTLVGLNLHLVGAFKFRPSADFEMDYMSDFKFSLVSLTQGTLIAAALCTM